MSATDRISIAYGRLSDWVLQLFGRQPARPVFPLVDELTRYFLSEAIKDRVQVLATNVSQEEEFRQSVTEEYRKRVEDAIRTELGSQSPRWSLIPQIQRNLNQIKLSSQLTKELCASPVAVIALMRTRGVFRPGRIPPLDAILIFGLFLRAVQQMTLDIIKLDYPARGAGTEIPDSTQAVLLSILGGIDEVAQRIRSPFKLKTAQQAETELKVLVARAKGGACLPLKPIATAPLGDDKWVTNYVGRSDEEAKNLARQIRHADGTFLVTGYRGVGKSSFVNRALFHALREQNKEPSDGLLIVPVKVNLAKIAGVQHVLRLTLRAVREALINPDNRKPCKIRGADESSQLKNLPLPLDLKSEIEPLEEAYIRATYKVTMSRGNGTEKKWEAGSSFSLDPGKLMGGSIVGIELGKFLEGGVKKTRIEKINRELSLLDYDENSAEDDLGRLIRSLARPRPLHTGGPDVKIKLVFVFDELDKMDIDLGLKPMIEGLKNLFLQQHSVFVLVTSKKFYYDLLKDRAIEDAMLNSYFSAIVHVPLLSFSEAYRMVEDWIDWNSTDYLKDRSPAELKLIDQVTRVLLYRSFGNPRDIIRELRKMQEWAEIANQPYLTDRVKKTPALQIFAAVQECIEKTAARQQSSTTVTSPTDGSVALASERLEGDEARLEQVRRGLYILTEELINRQTLLLEPRQAPSANDGPTKEPGKTNANESDSAERFEELLAKLAQPSSAPPGPLPLAKIQQDNFSLLSLEDVQRLAKHLGGYLKVVHDTADLFQSKEWGKRRPLFEMPSADVLRVTKDFYDLTGRQALAATVEHEDEETQKADVEELIKKAHSRAGQGGWAAKLSVIAIIKQLGSVPAGLEELIWSIAKDDPDPNHRLAAVECLSQLLFRKTDAEISTIVGNEKDQRVLGAYILLLGGAKEESRHSATEALLDLLKRDTASKASTLLTADALQAWTFLRSVADREATDELIAWLTVAPKNETVESTAVELLNTFASKFSVDIVERIFTNKQALDLFTGSSASLLFIKAKETPLRNYFRELLRPRPIEFAERLLDLLLFGIADLLAYLWDLGFDPRSEDLAVCVFSQWLKPSSSEFDLRPATLETSLRQTRDFQTRLVPYLRDQLAQLIAKNKYTEVQQKELEKLITNLSQPAEPLFQLKLDDSGVLAPGIPSGLKLGDLAKQENYPFITSQFKYSLPSKAKGGISFKPLREASQSLGFVALAFVAFLPGLKFYTRDLPEGAPFGKVLLSRLILLALDAAITYPFVSSVFRAQDWSYSPKTDYGSSSVFQSTSLKDVLVKDQTVIYSLLVPVVYAFYYVHTQYIGPLKFGNQVIQFLINLPTLFLLTNAYRLLVETATSGYRYSRWS